MKWIENASFMTATNEISCSNFFYCFRKSYITGYFIHRDCYEFIKKDSKINIVFGNFFHSAKNKLTLRKVI